MAHQWGRTCWGAGNTGRSVRAGTEEEGGVDELEAYPGSCRTARRRWRPDVDRRATGLVREMTEQVTSSGKADAFRQNAITNQEMSLQFTLGDLGDGG